MPRVKSEDRRNAILTAATHVFAERGLSAPTLAISTYAHIAEGSLFTYFKTKSELVNALYQQIKLELADAMMSGFPRRQSVKRRLQHVWDRYIEWGVNNPLQQRVLKQIELHSTLSEESQAAGMTPFLEVQKMADDAIGQRVLRNLPLDYIAATLNAMAEVSMDLMQRDSSRVELYQTAGFEMLWATIRSHIIFASITSEYALYYVNN
jgi:AcrR family transcriptional regulator